VGSHPETKALIRLCDPRRDDGVPRRRRLTAGTAVAVWGVFLAAVALRLRLKHVRQKVESGDGDDVDWGEVDRLARTVFDRTGYGKTETRELTGEGDADEIQVSSDVVTVTRDELTD
jgi:hypothetical protein